VYVRHPAPPRRHRHRRPGPQCLRHAEARRLFEGEVAALAATLITDEELAFLETLVVEMNNEEATKEQSEVPTANSIISPRPARAKMPSCASSGHLDLRYRSHLCLQMLERARDVRRRPRSKMSTRRSSESLRTRIPRRHARPCKTPLWWADPKTFAHR